MSATATINIEAVVAARAQVARPRYPDPPHQFAVSPDVETLWNRYEGHLQGREPLLSAANACLTWLEATHGGRRNVARKFRISQKIRGEARPPRGGAWG